MTKFRIMNVLYFCSRKRKLSVILSQKPRYSLTDMKQYEYMSPMMEILELVTDGTVLTGSTGESFNEQENYEGTWS